VNMHPSIRQRRNRPLKDACLCLPAEQPVARRIPSCLPATLLDRRPQSLPA